jgi:hypothetical protein
MPVKAEERPGAPDEPVSLDPKAEDDCCLASARKLCRRTGLRRAARRFFAAISIIWAAAIRSSAFRGRCPLASVRSLTIEQVIRAWP